MSDKIICYTDGACSGNPGPAGIGIILTYKNHKKEIFEYIGNSTNNIAELTAILRALENINDKNKEIIIYCDSMYSIGVLTKNWKVKANKELVNNIKNLIKTFPNIEILKVKAHENDELNNYVDELAKKSIKMEKKRV